MTDHTNSAQPTDPRFDPAHPNHDAVCGWCGELPEECESTKTGARYGEACDDGKHPDA